MREFVLFPKREMYEVLYIGVLGSQIMYDKMRGGHHSSAKSAKHVSAKQLTFSERISHLCS